MHCEYGKSKAIHWCRVLAGQDPLLYSRFRDILMLQSGPVRTPQSAMKGHWRPQNHELLNDPFDLDS